MNLWLVQFSAVALVVCSSAARAAPPQLLNKSIHLEMTVTIPAKTQEGTSAMPQQRVSQIIYISSQGRLFQKIARRAKGGSEDSAHGPDSGGNLHFAGNNLVAVTRAISGANMMTISFDPSFQSCTADLIVGADGDKPRVFKGLNGQTLIGAGKPVVSAVSCTIQDGNAFAS